MRACNRRFFALRLRSCKQNRHVFKSPVKSRDASFVFRQLEQCRRCLKGASMRSRKANTSSYASSPRAVRTRFDRSDSSPLVLDAIFAASTPRAVEFDAGARMVSAIDACSHDRNPARTAGARTRAVRRRLNRLRGDRAPVGPESCLMIRISYRGVHLFKVWAFVRSKYDDADFLSRKYTRKSYYSKDRVKNK